MGRAFAGFLASLAVIFCIARGVIHHAEPVDLLLQAFTAMWVFAGVGLIVGVIARRMVKESFLAQINASEEEADAATDADLAANAGA